jgi:hypothetical protein
MISQKITDYTTLKSHLLLSVYVLILDWKMVY